MKNLELRLPESVINSLTEEQKNDYKSVIEKGIDSVEHYYFICSILGDSFDLVCKEKDKANILEEYICEYLKICHKLYENGSIDIKVGSNTDLFYIYVITYLIFVRVEKTKKVYELFNELLTIYGYNKHLKKDYESNKYSSVIEVLFEHFDINLIKIIFKTVDLDFKNMLLRKHWYGTYGFECIFDSCLTRITTLASDNFSVENIEKYREYFKFLIEEGFDINYSETEFINNNGKIEWSVQTDYSLYDGKVLKGGFLDYSKACLSLDGLKFFHEEFGLELYTYSCEYKKPFLFYILEGNIRNYFKYNEKNRYNNESLYDIIYYLIEKTSVEDILSEVKLSSSDFFSKLKLYHMNIYNKLCEKIGCDLSKIYKIGDKYTDIHSKQLSHILYSIDSIVFDDCDSLISFYMSNRISFEQLKCLVGKGYDINKNFSYNFYCGLDNINKINELTELGFEYNIEHLNYFLTNSNFYFRSNSSMNHEVMYDSIEKFSVEQIKSVIDNLTEDNLEHIKKENKKLYDRLMSKINKTYKI